MISPVRARLAQPERRVSSRRSRDSFAFRTVSIALPSVVQTADSDPDGGGAQWTLAFHPIENWLIRAGPVVIFLLLSDAPLHADEADRRSGAQGVERHRWRDGCVCRAPRRIRRRSDAAQDASGGTEPIRVRRTGTCPEADSRGESRRLVSPGSSLVENRAFRLLPDRPGRIAAKSPASRVRRSVGGLAARANAAGPRGQEQRSEPRCLPGVCGYALSKGAGCDRAMPDQAAPTSSHPAPRETRRNSGEVRRWRRRAGAANSTEVHPAPA